jgi:hydrogenase maturation protease
MSGASGQRPVRVLVCGERLRGDDAAAIVAAAALPADARALAELVEVGQLSVEILLDVPDEVALIVADAAIGVAPGQVVTLPLAQIANTAGAAGGITPASSHSLPPDQVVALAGELRGSPLRGSFVGIGGAEFGLGEWLSPAVAASLPAFVSALTAEIRRLATTWRAAPRI